MESSIKTKLGEIEEITTADVVGLLQALSNKLSKQETSQVINVDGLATSFEYVSQSSTNAPSWASTDGAVLTMKGASNRQLWIGRDGEIGLRGGTGSSAYTDTWIQIGTRAWANSVFATIPALSTQKDRIDAIEMLLNSDQTTLDTLQEIVDYIQINRSDLENLTIGAIAGLQSALDGKASTNDARFHAHANKSILDAIDQTKVDEWDSNSAAGKVDKAGDTMTGVLIFENGHVKMMVPEVGSMWTGPMFLSEKSLSPWNMRLVVQTYASGAFKYGAFVNENNEEFLVFDGVGIGVGLPNGETATESIDAAGTARLREVKNASAVFFVKMENNGIIKKRTLFQTKFDLGISKIAISPQPGIVLSDATREVFSTFTGETLPVQLPDPGQFDKDKFSITVSRNVQLSFSDQIIDLHNEKTITTQYGSIQLVAISGSWYKVGAEEIVR